MESFVRIVSEWMKKKDNSIELNLSGIGLKDLPPLPANVKKLNISNNEITEIKILPSNLVELNCSNNKISKLSLISPKLEVLNCSNNNLKVYPNEGEKPIIYFFRLMRA